MKSVRIDPQLEARLKRAAELEGVSESEFIRAAIQDRADSTLGETLEDKLAGIVGAVHAGGGQASRAHQRYRELLQQRHRGAKSSRS